MNKPTIEELEQILETEREVDIQPDGQVTTKTAFQKALENLINTFSMENASDTPDFILARYLQNCLDAFDLATRERSKWHGHPPIGWTRTDPNN